jgi:TPR repeat protein
LGFNNNKQKPIGSQIFARKPQNTTQDLDPGIQKKSVLHNFTSNSSSEYHGDSLNDNTSAMLELGRKLIKDEDIKIKEQGFNLIMKAAKKGNADAKGIAGWHLIYGHGVDKNAIAGFNFCLDAYNNKTKISQDIKARLIYLVGHCYLNGIGTIKDIDKSIVTLTESAKLGFLDSHHELAVAYGFLALGLYEKSTHEEVLPFRDQNQDDSSNELADSEVKRISYAIKAIAHGMIYAQENHDFSLHEIIKEKLNSIYHKDKSENYHFENSIISVDTNVKQKLNIPLDHYNAAEKYAKDFMQSSKDSL